MNVKKLLHVFVLALYSGLCIGIGGTVYLSVDNSVIGGIFFSLGLLTILIFGFNLFTGKVGYIVTNKPSYLLEVFTVWLGNFAGTYLFALIIRGTRIFTKISEKCSAIVEVKQNDSYLSLFILGIFCGMLMFIAVDTYKKNHKEQGFLCCLVAIFCVVVFILSGYEHCIADMFYFALTGKVGACFVPLIVITLGNALGGNLIPIGQIISKKLAD